MDRDYLVCVSSAFLNSNEDALFSEDFWPFVNAEIGVLELDEKT
jgi:hypothetical protein